MVGEFAGRFLRSGVVICEFELEPMLVPLHIATLVLAALLLVTLTVWHFVGRSAGALFPFAAFGESELLPVPAAQRRQFELIGQWRLCHARRGSPAAPPGADDGPPLRVSRTL